MFLVGGRGRAPQKVVFADKYLSAKTTFYLTNNRELSYFIKIDVESHSFSLRKSSEHYP
jgi:hypothetical protein